MKILHISQSSGSGGAARAAYRIHLAQSKNGLDSSMLVSTSGGSISDVKVPKLTLSRFLRRPLSPFVDAAIARLQSPINTGLHSPGLSSSLSWREINRSDADVINLHWVQSGLLSIYAISRIKKPVVWTLHDMWAFSGAEHYDNGSRRWSESYSKNSRPTQDKGVDLNRFIFGLKKFFLRTRIQIVAPSTWMRDCVSDSSLMSKWPVRVIPYPIDATFWRPEDKKTSKHLLGLPSAGKIVLFGALGIGADSRKGFDLFVSSLDLIKAKVPEAVFVLFGDTPEGSTTFSRDDLHFLGRLTDDLSLKLAYSAADVFVLTSRQDNLPNTVLEAQACGTPVAAFDVGGLRDAVSHLNTGYLAEPFNIEDLAEGVSLLTDTERHAMFSEASRTRATRVFSPEIVHSEYLDLYSEVLGVQG